MRVEFVDFLFESIFLIEGAGGFLHTFFVGSDFGFDDFHFVRIAKPAFDAIKSDDVAAVGRACLIFIPSPS